MVLANSIVKWEKRGVARREKMVECDGANVNMLDPEDNEKVK